MEQELKEQLARMELAAAWDLFPSALQELRVAARGPEGAILPANLTGYWRGLVTDRDPSGNWVELRLVPERSSLEGSRLFLGEQPLKVVNGGLRGDPATPPSRQ